MQIKPERFDSEVYANISDEARGGLDVSEIKSRKYHTSPAEVNTKRQGDV